MEQLDKITDKLIGNIQSQAKPTQSLPRQSLSVQGNSNPVASLEYGIEDKIALNDALGACLVVQRTYGRQGEDMPATMRIFLQDLKQYTMPKIVDAVNKWRKSSPEFPTPADIIAILDSKPKMSVDMYRVHRKTYEANGFNEYTEAGQYVKAYEKEFGKE